MADVLTLDPLTYEPLTVEVDGITYRRIERLPRNARPGDLLRLRDLTGACEEVAYVIVTGVDTYPETTSGWRRYAPECAIRFRLRAQDNVWRWRSWNGVSKWYDGDTKVPTSLYRAA